MTDRILCPTDFSPFSAKALRHAVSLAQAFHARLKVVHVVANVIPGAEAVYGGTPSLLGAEERHLCEEALNRFLEPARAAGVDHEAEVREGEPWREIAQSAQEMGADLVVMGTRGRSGLQRLFLGSVAEKVIRSVPCPVLTVSHEETGGSDAPGLMSRILCATDFSETSVEALKIATGLARRFHAGLTLLHVIEHVPENTTPSHQAIVDVGSLRLELEGQARERLQKAIEETGDLETLIEPIALIGCAHKEILRAAARQRADLIVIGAQGHGFIEHLLSGSNAQHVIRRATCPVLTVRPQGRLPPRHDSKTSAPNVASRPA